MKTAAITIIMLFFCGNVWAECSTEQRVQLVQSGYSKAEVEQMCNKAAECCCYYKEAPETINMMMPYASEAKEHNIWMKADDCLKMNPRTASRVGIYTIPDDSAVPPSCTSASSCGR